MKKIIVAAALSIALTLLIGPMNPTDASAQTCWASCDVCTGSGHSYGTAGSPALGRDAHGCGGTSDCGENNSHTGCSPEAPSPENPMVAQLVVDHENLTHHAELSGQEIFEIVARSDGKVLVNLERGSIQQYDCTNPDWIVVNLPLTETQLTEFLQAQEL